METKIRDKSSTRNRLTKSWFCGAKICGSFVLTLGLLSACGSGTVLVAENEQELPTIRVGSLADPANKYLGNLMSAAIAGLGYNQPSSGVTYYDTPTDLNNALKEDKIDLAPISLATALEALTADSKIATSDPALNVELLEETLGSEFDVHGPSEAVLGYFAITTESSSQQLGESFSDISIGSPKVKITGPAGCFSPLEKVNSRQVIHPLTCGAALIGGYNAIEFEVSSTIDDAKSYERLRTGAVDIAIVKNSNPSLIGIEGEPGEFVVVADSASIQPSDAVSVVGKKRVFTSEVSRVVDSALASLTVDDMRRATSRIESGHDPQLVASCDAAARGLAVKPNNC